MAGGQPQYAQHYKSCHHDTRNKIGSRLVTIKKSPFKGFFQKMGNKLSCSCGPLKIKGYRFDDPWAANPRTRRDGHLLRLWAEVFHVTTSGSGTVKWQQVSEDLVPVNIACVADDPQLVFHITAYNSQVDKILDVRLVQPGTRIGQASECFVYWKDPATSDTWGLNFTSPIDAKQFRECCDGSRSNSSSRMRAKAASSRSTPASPSRSREPQCTCSHPDTLGGKPRQPHPEHRMRAATSCGMASGMNGQAIGNGNGSNTLNSVKRKPMSTPSSPTRDRKVQCTCMTPEQFAHLHRYQYSSTSRPDLKDIGKECTCHGKLGLSETEPEPNPKHKGSGTLSRNQAGSREDLQSGESRDSRVSTAANSQASSVYDNVKESQRRQEGFGSVRDRPDRRNIRGSQRDIQDSGGGSRSSHGRPRHGASTGSLKLKKDLLSKSVDYSDMDTVREGEKGVTRKQRSKSIDHLNQSQDKNCRFDSRTLKKLLTPVGAVGSDSPLTSPETGRRASGRRVGSYDSDRDGGFMSEPEIVGRGSNRGRRGRGAHFDRDIGRPSTGNNAAYRKKAKEKLFLDFQDGDGEGEGEGANSPSSDVAGMFENQCYATTPSSSNGGESDFERDDGPDSPTSRLLMEYEEHLRNTLEKGMDAESYSLHTFEALLTQSMENLESILGERSRNIARIKRDQFQRGVSCIEPLRRDIVVGDERRERPSLSRGVSWIDSQPEDSPTPIRNTTPVRGPSPNRGTSPNLGAPAGKETSPILRTTPSSGESPNRRPSPNREPSPVEIHSSDSGENSHSMARSRTAENLKLKDLISIRRGSGQIDQKPKDQLTVSGLNPLNLRSKDRPTLVRGVSCMEPIPKPRGFLTRGASCSSQQHPMTPERPPMNRGASCQTQRVFPAITITRPFSTHEDSRPKIDLLSAVNEIHDQFKDTSIKPSDDEFTEDETEDEFHEYLQESEMKSLGMLPHSPLKTRKSDKDRAQTLPGRTGLGPGQQRPMIGRPMSVNSSFDSHTSHNHNPHPRDTSFARDSSFDSRRSGPDTGYYSDRNEAARNGYRDERGYLSDHSSRGLAPNYRQDSIRSGYISDHESRSGYERGDSIYGGHSIDF